MSDTPETKITRANDDLSLVSAVATSKLIARGRLDVARLADECIRCGNRKELVFAGCVCKSCSEAIDERWAGSTTNYWVLVAKEPPESDWYAFSIVTWLAVIRELERIEN